MQRLLDLVSSEMRGAGFPWVGSGLAVSEQFRGGHRIRNFQEFLATDTCARVLLRVSIDCSAIHRSVGNLSVTVSLRRPTLDKLRDETPDNLFVEMPFMFYQADADVLRDSPTEGDLTRLRTHFLASFDEHLKSVWVPGQFAQAAVAALAP